MREREVYNNVLFCEISTFKNFCNWYRIVLPNSVSILRIKKNIYKLKSKLPLKKLKNEFSCLRMVLKLKEIWENSIPRWKLLLNFLLSNSKLRNSVSELNLRVLLVCAFEFAPPFSAVNIHSRVAFQWLRKIRTCHSISAIFFFFRTVCSVIWGNFFSLFFHSPHPLRGPCTPCKVHFVAAARTRRVLYNISCVNKYAYNFIYIHTSCTHHDAQIVRIMSSTFSPQCVTRLRVWCGLGFHKIAT